MRKIWGLRKEKDKRKSISSSAFIQQTQEYQYEESEFASLQEGGGVHQVLNPRLQQQNQTSRSIVEMDFQDESFLGLHPITRSINDASTLNSLSSSTVQSAKSSHSVSAPTTPINSTHSHNTHKSGGSNGIGSKSVASLAKPDYDTKSVKNSWLNVIVNLHSVNEINEQALKLFRVELKGSHLYLYKPPATLNIKSFKVNNDEQNLLLQHVALQALQLQPSSGHSAASFNTTGGGNFNNTGSNFNITGGGNFNTTGINTSIIGNPTPIEKPDSITQPPNPLGTHHSNSSSSLTTTPILDIFKHNDGSNLTIHEASSNEYSLTSDYSITFYETTIPHPELNYDFDQHQFTLATASISLSYVPSLNQRNRVNTIEALIHFVLFSTDELDDGAVNSILSTMPILPNFGKILKLICSFLTGIFTSKFKGDFDLKLIIQRVLNLLYNIELNFNGYLLKSDIAPWILRILEIFSDELSAEVAQGTQGQQSSQAPPAPPRDIEKSHSRKKSVTSTATNVSSYTTNDIEVISTNEKRQLFADQILRIQDFKNSMLQKQQTLINLVTNDHIPQTDIPPLQDLNSSVFMDEINLFEFAATVTSIDLNFFNNWNSNIDKSLLLYSSINSSFEEGGPGSSDFFYKKNPLIFNNDHHVHYLSRLLINHLFVENAPSLVNPVVVGSASTAQPSNGTKLSSAILDRKARLIEKWIDLGCLLDKSGNMSSWLGISSIILSQPVLRLIKIWSLVSPEYIKLLKNDWSPVLFELDRRYLANGSLNSEKSDDSKDGEVDVSKDSYHIMAPRGLGKIYPKETVIPYFGDLVINNSSSSTTNILELESIWKRINYSFNRWNEYLSNLTNYDDIIKYNDDVLRRYDNMRFIFSNESLNQALYLGVNDDSRPLRDEPEEDLVKEKKKESEELKYKLIRLIELNCDSINLEKIMKLSLSLEPDLPEAYLKLPQIEFKSSSSISLHSNESAASLNASLLPPSTLADDNPSARLPTFNNSYFKVNLSKYDELVSSPTSNNTDAKTHLQQILDPSLNKHNFVFDADLTFRIDDFVSDLDTSPPSNALDDVDNVDDEDDVPGLGIDVDDILNSDKFKNFTITPKIPNSVDAAEEKVNNEKKPNNYSVISTESNGVPTFKYIPKYASVDKLIDLLLIDSKYFDQNISLDLTEYRFVFLLNYNTFITTKDLLDKLAHRFINSGNAVISVMKKLYLLNQNPARQANSGYPQQSQLSMEFPNWSLDTEVDLNELGEVDYELLLKIQINILKVLIVLVNNFYSNFALDLLNKTILIKLLKLFSNEILQWYNSKKIDATLEKSFESLVNYYKKLKKLFVKKTYRPIEVLRFDEYLIKEFRFSNSLHDVPMNRNLPGHKNVAKIEKFLHKFNKLLAVFYKGIKAEDWVKCYKVLEHSFEHNALFEFHLQKTNTQDENLVISNIFNLFESLVDPEEKQLVLKKFPLVFRKLFKIYFKFRAYLLVQLTDLSTTVEERLDRMKTLLLMVQISKLKMSDNQFVFEGSKECIPSCIESAITNVIYSPESRLFTNLWVKASNSLNEEFGSATTPSYDDLNLLLPSYLTLDDLQSPEPLLPCFGWIIEILLETNRCPSFYKDIINFNKRYLIFKLIKELGIEDLDSGTDLGHHDTREFEFLLNLDETLINPQSLRDFTLLDKDKVKMFRSVLHTQRKILVVDNKKKQLKDNRDLVLLNQSSQIIAGPNLANTSIVSSQNHTLNKKSSNSSLRRQSLSYKSNSSSRFKISGLFNKSRPFSLTVSALTNPDKVIPARELPPLDYQQDPKQKAFLVISLKNKKIFPVYLMPLCFKIDSETSNDDYFFQAPSEGELNDWMVRLSYANRHWFYSRTLNLKSNHSFTTFGIPINVICNREQSLTPKILTSIFEFIENDGIKDVGIYRISSSISELAFVKLSIDKIGSINFDERAYDIHTLTSVVKSYFRELPDALLTDKVIDAFFLSKQVQEDETAAIERYKETLAMLPLVNYHTLRSLLKHLRKVAKYSDKNKMTASNIATVIGPALTEASSLDSLINNFGFMNSILERLINNYEAVFDVKSAPFNITSSAKDDHENEQSNELTDGDTIKEEDDDDDD